MFWRSKGEIVEETDSTGWREKHKETTNTAPKTPCERENCLQPSLPRRPLTGIHSRHHLIKCLIYFLLLFFQSMMLKIECIPHRIHLWYRHGHTTTAWPPWCYVIISFLMLMLCNRPKLQNKCWNTKVNIQDYRVTTTKRHSPPVPLSHLILGAK